MLSKLNKKHYLIALIVILVLSAAGLAYYKLIYLPAQALAADSSHSQVTQTAIVQQGNLAVYARGTGTLFALNEIKLGFGSSGPIADIKAQVGDMVNKGDVLAVQGNREQFEAAVAADQLVVLSAKQEVEKLYDEADIFSAQAKIDLVKANAALARAKYKWKIFQGAMQIDPILGKKHLASAWKDLVAVRDEYYAKSRNASPSRKAELGKELKKAGNRYQNILYKLNGLLTESQKAQHDAELDLARAIVLQAERALEKVKDGPNPDKVALAEQTLASAEATLAVSQRQLDASLVIAPIDGTILSVKAQIGDDVSKPFITMADLSQRYLKISLDGTDIGKIALRYKVEVVFDALPNQIFTGSVNQIDPNLYTPSGEQISNQTPGQITVIKALVILNEGTTPIDNLPLGMTATVNVIGAQAEGVVLVPIESLRERAPGKYAVIIIENGEQKLRPVEVGLMDFSFAEIKSGLKVGDVVVTSTGPSK